MKAKLIVGALVLVASGIGYLVLTTEVFKRQVKDVQSNWLGGLNRICTVYSDTGTVLKKYKGRFDLKFGPNKLNFDNAGKRSVVVGGTTICDEQ